MTSTCRITDDWLPLPADVLAALGWTEGTCVSLEVVEGVGLVLTRSLVDTDPAPRPARPARRRSL